MEWARIAKWIYLSAQAKSFMRFDCRVPVAGRRLALQSAAVLRYEKSLGKCRNRAAITDGVGLREATDKAAVLTVCGSP